MQYATVNGGGMSYLLLNFYGTSMSSVNSMAFAFAFGTDSFAAFTFAVTFAFAFAHMEAL